MTRAARLALALALPLALLLPVPAAAQGIDLARGGGVEITAEDGIEWRQAEQVVIARGDARAVRDGVTVTADRLIARYRPQGGEAATQRPAPAGPEAAGGSSEIWRLEAEGHVRIVSATDTARGDRAVYDVDQAVLVLSGRNLSLETGQQVITARDSLEYWSQRRMAVARGGAVIVDRQDGRRITADTIVAYFLEDPASPAAAQPAAARARTPSGSEVPGAGRLDRVEAFGNVEIRTPLEVVRGDRAAYSAATGLARLLGEVRITRGDNQLNGREAIVNLTTGVARLVAAPGGRVQGLVMPQQQQGAAGGSAAQPPLPGAEGRGTR